MFENFDSFAHLIKGNYFWTYLVAC